MEKIEITPEQRALMAYLLERSHARRKGSEFLLAEVKKALAQRKVLKLPIDWQVKEYSC